MKKNKIIIAGPRNYTNYEFVKTKVQNILKNLPIDSVEIVSGGCDDEQQGRLTFTRDDGTKVYGVDGLGERFAKEFNYPVKILMADWKKNKKAAGPIRNKKMAKYATHAICFWNKKSKGTESMINLAKEHIPELNIRIIYI